MSVETIDELLLDELKDLYSAEKQITKSLPKLAKAATSPDLSGPLKAISMRRMSKLSGWTRLWHFDCVQKGIVVLQNVSLAIRSGLRCGSVQRLAAPLCLAARRQC